MGKTPRGTPGTERDNLLSQLESMVQDAVAVIPDDSSVDIVEGQKTSSSTIYAELLMYCRSEISIALLGQNQTTEANSNKASATAGLEVTQDIRDADVSIIESAMNELIRWIVEVNTGSDAAPTFSMWEQEEVNEVQAKRDEILTRAGGVFKPAYWKRTYDLQDTDIEMEPPKPEPDTPAFAEGDQFVDASKMVDIDPIDQAINEEMADWQPVMDGLIDPIQAAFDQALKDGLSAAAIIEQLPDLLRDMKPEQLQESLAKAAFAARLVAALGVNVGADSSAQAK